MIEYESANRLMDIENENSASLETIGDDILAEWKAKGKKVLWFGVGLSLFSVALLLVAWSDWFHDRFLASMISIVCLGGIGWGISIISTGFSKICSSPPLAGETGKDSLARLFEACADMLYANHCAKLRVVPTVEAFLCLLDKAKEQTGYYAGFVETLRSDARKLWQELNARFKELSDVKIEIEKMVSAGTDGLFFRYESFFVVTAYKRLQGGSVTRLKEIGKLRVKIDKQLARIGGRFYLTDARCQWIVLE